jgi:SAM-dependent methyltransferase
LQRLRLARALASGYPDFLMRRLVEDLDERLGAVLRPFPHALDLGSPTGHVADMLHARPGAELVTRLAALPGAGVDVVGDEEALPFGAGAFDLVVSVMALHGINDLPGALAQVRRALRPDGLFMAAMLGGRTLTELRAVLLEAESAIEGGASPRVAPFADLRDLGALLQRAGLALPVADSDLLTLRYGSAVELMRDLRAMGLTNALSDRSRRPLRRETLMRALSLYQERHADADGRIRASFEVVWLSGWAPHESQQKPLRPGSAKARLADALNAIETKLPGRE